ncbi:Phosphatidylinositol N-acetylglucosaminyltransferase subunit C [Holothuria leucospilota]|uniref:Phosphatidylinositol N-acetylglucosaminyltransferase subunit C n=1 Tax=Holothuria leucospilota TaxID=206669 RepID=A0A9Q1C5Q8_HOLLE|nr:Phosphatidylinositol N-acetylglucosaminyltransferase subunit C [Holothuria leucospilota]
MDESKVVEDEKGALKWRKVLYLDQGVPDNYVDSTFLDELQKNVYIRTYEYWNVVKETGVVTQQLSSICIFVVMFIFMSNQQTDPITILGCSLVVTALGFLLYDWIDQGQWRKEKHRSCECLSDN